MLIHIMKSKKEAIERLQIIMKKPWLIPEVREMTKDCFMK